MTNNSNLPPHWSWVKLGEVCKVKGGFAFKSKDYTKEGLPLVRISNIEDKKISLEDCVYIKPHDETKIKEFVLHKGDILIALSGATTVKYGVYNLDQKAFLNQRIGRLHFNGSDKIIPSYVYLYLEIIRSEILKTAYGAAQPNISPSEIADFPIPLPPLPKQKKIVEKIEELFTGLDSGVASLKKAKEQLRLYRQSVLASAFSGQLTGNVKGETKNRELPQGWKWMKLGEIAEVKRGKSKHRPRNAPKLYEGEYPFIQTGEIREANGGTITAFKQTYNEIGLSQSKLWPKGTLCISIAANIGETAFLGFDACFPDSIVGVIPNKNILDRKFINYFFMKEKEKISGLAPATAQKNINVDILQKLDVPLPSIAKQTQIVAEIEKRFSESDNLEKAIDESLSKAETLRQSILKNAFEGRLI